MTSRHLTWLLGSALLLATPALANGPPPPQQAISVGYSWLHYYAYLHPSYDLSVVDATYERVAGADGPLRFLTYGGGLRLVFPFSATIIPVEAFLRGGVRAPFGFWEPSMHFELGYSRARLAPDIRQSTGAWGLNEQARLTPLYVAATASPLRFHFDRFAVSALDLQLGAFGSPFGSVLRVQLGLLRAEVSL